jgi:hypothetical protein
MTIVNVQWFHQKVGRTSKSSKQMCIAQAVRPAVSPGFVCPKTCAVGCLCSGYGLPYSSCIGARRRCWLPSNTHARFSNFPILGIDTDNDGEFVNEAVVAYCEQEQITFTQGRPYLKNDHCFME